MKFDRTEKHWFRAFSLTLLILGGLLMLSGCSSTKDLQKKLRANPVGLGYSLNTVPYRGERCGTVVLKELGAANMDYQTWVKNRRQVLVPLVLYNYHRSLYDVGLGEQSLDQPYRDFFLNALYAESDHSGCFYLQPEVPEEPNDSLYILEIYFDSICTRGKIKCVESIVVWFDDDLHFGQGTLENHRYSLQDVGSDICAHVGLYKGAKCVLRKSYRVEQPYACRLKCADLNDLSYYSMHELAKALSVSTRELIENIVQEVSLIVSGRYNAPVPASPLPPAAPDQSDTPADSSH